MTDHGGIFAVTGPVVVNTAARVVKSGCEAIAAGSYCIDMGGVSDVDSSSVAAILAWIREAKSKNLELRIVNLPESVRNLAAVYGVSEILPS